MEAIENFRAITINLWGEQPPLDRRLEILVAGLKALAPDVVALQEVRQIEGKLPNTAATLAARCGMQWVWAPATQWGGGDEGVAILSRHPIGMQESHVLPESRPEESRVVLMARLDTPAGGVFCYTTHLHYRLAQGIERERQVLAVDEFVRAHPSELPQLVMGDFNATPEHDEIRFLRGLHTLEGRRVTYQDAWQRCHPEALGFTWAKRNPFTQKLRWLECDRRIDYIFVTPMRRDGRGEITRCEIVFDEADADNCFASDHFGLLAEVRIAPLAE